MLPTCKKTCLSVICFCFLAAPSGAASEVLADFLDRHQGVALDKFEIGSRCIKTTTSLVCIEVRNKKPTKNNSRANQAILDGMGIRVRKSIYDSLLENVQIVKFKDASAVKSVYKNGISSNDERYVLRGIEFITLDHNDRYIAAASVAYLKSIKYLENLFLSPHFSDEYCKYQLINAKNCISDLLFDKSLQILKEVRDLNYNDPELYILAAEAFWGKNDKIQAASIANSVFETMLSGLTYSACEQLGNIFMQLGNFDNAKICYNLASERFDEDVTRNVYK